MTDTQSNASSLSTATFIRTTLAPFRRYYAAILALTAGEATCGMLAPWALGKLIDSATAAGQTNMSGLSECVEYLAAFIALVIGDPLLARCSGMLFVRLLGPQRHRGVLDLFSHLQTKPYAFFTENTPGALGHRLSQTAIGINEAVGCILFDFWPTLIGLSVAVVLLFNASYWLGSAALAWLIVYFWWSYRAARRAMPSILEAAEAENASNAHLCDSLTNQLAVICYRRHAHEAKLIDARQSREMVSIRTMMKALEQIRWFQFCWTVMILSGVTVGAYALLRCGLIELGAFAMVTGLCLGAIGHTHNLSQRMLDFFGYWGKIEAGTRQLVSTAPETDNAGSFESLIGKSLRFESISVAYVEGKPVLRDVCLEIRAGERIAIVGPSGAGKSTILHVLLGLVSPCEGRITLGQTDIKQISAEALRQQIVFLPQEPLLFRRSFADNIRYGNLSATLPEVERAARMARCEDAIKRQPRGFTSSLDDDGVGLSRGELQRVALARTLLRDATVVLLDEATANLDALTETCLHQAVLASIRKDQTLIIVTHRLAVCTSVDRVCLVNHGRIDAAGRHPDLLRTNALYQSLWTHSMSNSIGD